VRAADQPDAAARAAGAAARMPLLDEDEAWSRLPAVEEASSQRLPGWGRALARTLPRTTAAMLRLDYLYRTSSEFDPKLRARMRWAAARANRCDYSKAYAEADLLRAGGTPEDVRQLGEGFAGLSAAERSALAFARTMTLSASDVTDEDMERLIADFGERAVVAMVLQLAYANFQDRLLLGLGIDVEPGGPLPPLEVLFAPPPADSKPEPAERPELPPPPADGGQQMIDDAEWKALDFGKLQERMELQRLRSPRIGVPAWESVARQLDPKLYPPDKPTQIRWSLVVVGYQPELGPAWVNCLRAFGREANQDRAFEESLFWVITRSLQCFY
jgi:alkylhydroperoxidase family enzyme